MKNIFPVLLVCAFYTSVAQHTDSLPLLVQRWNTAHSAKDSAAFAALYDAHVLYYGTALPRKATVNSKTGFLSKNPGYAQNIRGAIATAVLGKDEWKCSFIKNVTVKSSRKDYNAYLIFRKVDGQWKIIAESDEVTDRNLANKKAIGKEIPAGATPGDYNGDGKKEYMWLSAPETTEDMDCVGPCNCYIRFSDPAIPAIMLPNCIGGTPTNRGDLNTNGSDEVGLLPEWFTSCWAGYHVWTLLKGKWVNAVAPFSTHCNQWEQGIIPVEIDRRRKGNVIIRYSISADEIGSKSVKIMR